MVGIKLPLGEMPTACTIDYPSSRCAVYQSTGLNEVKIEAKAKQMKRNQHSSFALLKSSTVKGGKDPQIHLGRGQGAWHSGSALSEKRADCKQQQEIQLQEIYEQQCPETQ